MEKLKTIEDIQRYFYSFDEGEEVYGARVQNKSGDVKRCGSLGEAVVWWYGGIKQIKWSIEFLENVLKDSFSKTEVKSFQYGNVLLNREGRKIVYRESTEDDVNKNKEDFILFCEKEHGDGDFSYLCRSSYCRCKS